MERMLQELAAAAAMGMEVGTGGGAGGGGGGVGYYPGQGFVRFDNDGTRVCFSLGSRVSRRVLVSSDRTHIRLDQSNQSPHGKTHLKGGKSPPRRG